MIVTVTPNPVLDRTLTVPRLAFDEVLRATAVQLDCGGKGFNVSRALKELGLESVAMGFAGGATGRMLEDGLHSLGIETDFVAVEGETRTNVVVREEATERYIKVNEPGPAVSTEAQDTFLRRVATRARAGDAWILAGSLPPGLQVDFYAKIIRLLKARQVKVYLDGSGEPLRLGCHEAPTLVKPNVLEAEQVTGRPIGSQSDVLDAARHLLRMGIETVALSLGAEGLLLASAQEAVWAAAPAVESGNPTGAGDALLAGITWASEQGLPLEEMARWGVAAGTVSASKAGVSTGTKAEVESMHDHVATLRQAPWAGTV